MEFRILGPLEARENGVVLSLGGAKQRAVLAVLSGRAGRTSSDGVSRGVARRTRPTRAGAPHGERPSPETHGGSPPSGPSLLRIRVAPQESSSSSSSSTSGAIRAYPGWQGPGA